MRDVTHSDPVDKLMIGTEREEDVAGFGVLNRVLISILPASDLQSRARKMIDLLHASRS